MSLRDLAIRRLAILRGETGDETSSETVKRHASVFHPRVVRSALHETHFPQIPTDSEACFTVSVPKQRNSETALPQKLTARLDCLRRGSVPPGVDAAVWKRVVTDAVRLGADGWAAKALNLGWSALDLFGALTDPEGDPAADGLAVKLCGRRVLAICEGFATVADESGGRSYLHRGDTSGARLLWELGRGKETGE